VILYRVLLGIDAAIVGVLLYFFLAGLAEGTVTSFNMALWLGLLIGVAAVLAGGIVLRVTKLRRLANVLLLVLAIPGVLIAVLLLAFIVLHPDMH
jgi:hypothetical protein